MSDKFEASLHFVVLLGDFNDRSSAATERAQLDSLLTSFGKKQLITEPKQILENSLSCIDLVFTSKSNVVLHSTGHSSLHRK